MSEERLPLAELAAKAGDGGWRRLHPPPRIRQGRQLRVVEPIPQRPSQPCPPRPRDVAAHGSLAHPQALRQRAQRQMVSPSSLPVTGSCMLARPSASRPPWQ
jgi:hypothetical protein